MKRKQIVSLLIAMAVCIAAAGSFCLGPAEVRAIACAGEISGTGTAEAAAEGNGQSNNKTKTETTAEADMETTAEADTEAEAAAEADIGAAAEAGMEAAAEAAEAATGRSDGIPTEAAAEAAEACEEAAEAGDGIDIEETTETVPESMTAEELQAAIDELPSLSEYDYLPQEEKDSTARTTAALRECYYADSEEERSKIDPSRLFALDLYISSYAYYQTEKEYSGQLTLEERDTQCLSTSEMGVLQEKIDQLPALEEITDTSSVAVAASGEVQDPSGDGDGTSENGEEISCQVDYAGAGMSTEEADDLYLQVYDAAEDYYNLPESQTEVIDSGNLPALTAYYSVGVDAYNSSGPVGTITDYTYCQYSGNVSTSRLHYGFYKVSTTESQGEVTAFCMDSNASTPGQAGTALVSQTPVTNETIRTILYYGYGGPGELVSHDSNGYCETHMAICYAQDGKASNNTFGQAAYHKLYTNVSDKTVFSYVTAWSVSTGVSGTQPLVFALFDQPEEPEEEVPEKISLPFTLQKEDADLPENSGENGLTLEGAVFALENIEDASVWYFETDAEGFLDFSSEEYLLPEWTLREDEETSVLLTSAPVEKDQEGRLVCRPGTYWIHELRPPQYYSQEGSMNLEGSSQSAAVTEGLYLTIRQEKDGDGRTRLFIEEEGADSVYGAGDTEEGASAAGQTEERMLYSGDKIRILAYDKLHYNTLHVKKYGSGGQPLSGASYTLTRKSDGTVAEEKTTGEDGSLTWEDLLPGAYELTETEAPEGYELLAEPIELILPGEMTEEEAAEKGADLEKAYYDAQTGQWCFPELTYEITDAQQLSIPMTGAGPLEGFSLGAAGMLCFFAAFLLLRVKLC